MIKPTPNPPTPENDSPPESRSNIPPHTSIEMFTVNPAIDTESLLAYACESLASASVLASDFAVFLDESRRPMLLGIQQVIMLAELTVNRALDNIEPPPRA
ncbi:DUF6124 family protein [Pseudomonas sp. 14P_8.1_Bac3]|uniref:DUF6124 family protein n=1 Tax=Pseudomonas sp. 14P_8.1_Bac3 TaxID=2971621 RepID=UPI0021CA9AAE|nr:DUF6124 family protein [Pseudomonas sp. 14P_8.1_Bac3]MCU1763864.1 DUF6124 family protein [Pseudomonas sp. 14P_8.1_Bac3]